MALTDNLVSYYKFDSGALTTDSVGANTLTNNNTVAGTASGKIGYGADFGTSGSKFFNRTDALGLTTSSAYTYSVWFKLNIELGADYYTIGGLKIGANGGQSNFLALLYDYNGGTRRLHAQIYRSVNGTIFNTITLGTTNWYHLVFTDTGTTQTLYLNGISVGTPTALSGTQVINSEPEFTIGSYPNGAGLYNLAITDEVGIWSRALSATEVAGLYNNNLGSQYSFTDLKTAKAVVEAGGGGGGYAFGGGGGAGGYKYDSARYLSVGTYAVSIGDGGAGATVSATPGVNGNNSVFNLITAVGGGGGGSYNTSTGYGVNGANGANGGGGSWGNGSGKGSAGGTGTDGYNGGGYTGGSANVSGGGGGGSSAVGSPGETATVGGFGGAGTSNPIQASAIGQNVSGTYYLAGGGGGGSNTINTQAGGNGGGGAGGFGNPQTVTPTAGTANTGGGAGGGGFAAGALGGSGVVIIEYTTADFSFTYSGTSTTGTDGSLTWVAMKTSGDLVLSGAASGPANLKTWNGLAKASIKTIDGCAIASVKSINNLL